MHQKESEFTNTELAPEVSTKSLRQETPVKPIEDAEELDLQRFEQVESHELAKARRTGLRIQIESIVRRDEYVSLRKGPVTDVKVLQGDIFRSVIFTEDVFKDDRAGLLYVPQILFPYVVVLTQACDLDNATTLLSVLVAPLYNSEHVFAGEHLSKCNIPSSQIKKKGTKGQQIIKNNVPRYHHLEFPEGVQLPEAIIDFRHYFSVNLEYLRSIRDAQLAWTVPPLWREHIAQRFAAFLSRIGLPQPTPPPDTDRVLRALKGL